MSDIAKIVPKIRPLPLFAEFTATELDAFADLVDVETFAGGETVVKQDEPGDAMFIIVEGSARVVHRAGERTLELATLSKGDFFGEIALVDEGPRSADVIAVAPSTLLSVSEATIRALAGVYPSASFKLLVAVGRVLVSRLRAGNQKYVDSLLTTASQ
ncbi:MAG TPA: cyclic nucleotide-binding domain-containing protein [Chthoniobacterales bacterium]